MTEHPTPTPQALLGRPGSLGTATVIRGNARCLPLADNTVDLVVTSPPYFALRSYQDEELCLRCIDARREGRNLREMWPDYDAHAAAEHHRGHYPGQIGDEPTPTEFIDALIEVTAECMRVLKPSGSLWVNLGDKYAQTEERSRNGNGNRKTIDGFHGGKADREPTVTLGRKHNAGVRQKSLIGIPWRYALRCIDDLGLILRAEVIWSKPNGLPESVTDRVRRSHETWLHFTLEPRYFSAVDEIREPHSQSESAEAMRRWRQQADRTGRAERDSSRKDNLSLDRADMAHPLGKLPGSVWTVPTEPLQVPAHLGVDHFAAFPTEWPRRIIMGWSPLGVCVECGEGRRPVVVRASMERHNGGKSPIREYPAHHAGHESRTLSIRPDYRIDGYTCACDPRVCRTCFWIGRDDLSCDLEDSPCCDGCTHGTPAPTAPAVVLDPFGGTGTTALVAKGLGRHGISVDMSLDYGRLARWRTNDLDHLAKVQGIKRSDQARAADGLDMDTLFDFDGGAA